MQSRQGSGVFVIAMEPAQDWREVPRRGLTELVELLGLRVADVNHGAAAYAALGDAVAVGDGERASEILRAELEQTLTLLQAPRA